MHKESVFLYSVPTNSQIWLVAEYLLKEVTSNEVNAFFLKFELALNNLLLYPHRVICLCEWQWSGEQFSKENAEAPDVHWERVASGDTSKYLGRSVAYGTAVRVSPEVFVVLIGELLGKAEVYYFDVALLVDHDVVRLEISVDDLLRVEQVHASQDFSAVERNPVSPFLVLS